MKGQCRKVVAALLVAAAVSGNAWAESTGVYVVALGFDELKIVEPRHGRSLGRGSFELTQEELAGINQMYQEAISRALNKVDSYHLAETAEEATVSVAADVMRFAPLAPKDDLRSRGTFEKFYSEGAGQGTLEFAIASDEGKVVEVKVTRRAGYDWAINNRFNNRRNVQKMVNAWASEIVQQLKTI